MATKTQVRWQERIDRPYQAVHDVLLANSRQIFHESTHAAETRAGENIVDLHTNIAGVEVHREVLIDILKQTEVESEDERRTIIDLEWKSADATYLFPTMKAQLHVLPVGERAQLDFRGEYDPPMGVVGRAIDAAMGAKVAESSVKHFLEEVVEHLRNVIPEK
jgi:cell division ATPase FtsA